MDSFIDDLLAADPQDARERVRASLRVAVAEALLLRMESLDLSKSQLADRLGVSRSAITQALTGTRNLSLNLLADLAQALGVSPRFVLEPVAPAVSPAQPAAVLQWPTQQPGRRARRSA